MPGQPQVREAGWLYGPDPYVPLAHVRLEQRMDGSGRWDLYLADPASARPQHAVYGSEQEARDELERVYAAGRADGDWRIHRPGH